MKNLMLFLLVLSNASFAADNIIVPKYSGKMFLKDANGLLFPAKISYTTDGSGHLHLINSSNPVDDDITVANGKAYLNGADGKLYPAEVHYTTDGDGNVIPIPTTDLTAYMQKSNNLSDVASASTSRFNLGLGTASTQNSTAFDNSGSAATAQAFSIQRSNHTGTQLASTISDFVSAVASSIGFTPENVANKDNGALSTSTTTYPTSGAAKTFGLSLVGGLPSGVYPTQGNKFDFRLSKDGLLMQSYNMPAATAGAFNGGGTGNKGILGFDNYNNLAFSALTDLSFTARSVRDEFAPTILGNIYWNILANFNSGALTTANDYVNIAIDGLSQHKTNSFKYFVLTNTQTTYDLNSSVLATERMVKAVGGTEGASNMVDGSGAAAASITCTYTSGSAVVTGCSNTASMIVGQYVAADTINGEYGSVNKVDVGARIQSIDSGTQYTLTSNAIASGTVAAWFYGGINPPSRTITCSGTTTVTLAATDDIQVNTLISGTNISAHSFVVSKVRNTSLTLNNSCTTGTTTANFSVGGKVGMPSSNVNVGISWATVVTNNPNGFFWNGAPVTPTWTASDGGWPKNSVQSAINLVQGGSSTLDARINSVKSVTINSDTYSFTNQ